MTGSQPPFRGFLKTYWIFSLVVHKSIPLTHDLYGIVQRLGENNEAPYSEQLEELTPYATIRCYEEGGFEITPDDIKNSLTIEHAILKWCKVRIR